VRANQNQYPLDVPKMNSRETDTREDRD
jgi:hypothetical protein